MRYSIRKRLLLSAAVVLSSVAVFSGIIVWQSSQRASDEAYDRVLGAAALSIADTIAVSGARIALDLPYASFVILGTSGRNRIFYRVVAPDGNLVTGTPVLGIDRPLLRENGTTFFDSRYRGERIRVAQVARFHHGGDRGGWFNVFVGETREARDQLSQRLTRFALTPAMLAILLGIVLLMLAIRSSFAPLRRIEDSLGRRSPSDLSPIRPDVPEEVAALVAAINRLMARLETTLGGLKRVTVDAAHQLRTPLAAIRAVSELAIEAKPGPPVDDYVLRIHGNAIAATDLANRLMLEARLLHSIESGSAADLNVLDLARRVRQVALAEWRYLHDLPEIRLHHDRLTNPILHANETALSELLKNVLENAVKHGAGPIDIVVGDRPDQVIFRVQDRGPGLPAEIEDRAFERFVKTPGSRQGSGLDLAIAKQIVDAYCGTIRLVRRPGGGLEVEIRLPRWPAKAAPRKDSQ